MKRSLSTLSLVAIAVVAVSLAGCKEDGPQSTSGVQKATVNVAVNPRTGRTVEQDNIAGRLKMDNTPGSIKHLYIIAPESGQVIIYSTVQGKVTSSGKRLSPKTVNSSTRGFNVQFGSETHYTSEVLQDDGTYGDSAEYIYWFDAQGRYHQHYFTGGQIIHISDQTIAVKSVVINMELTVAPGVVVPGAAPAAGEKK
ncbi:MAG: hypothetical protein C0465_25865 [Ralstonia sp.]|uniref:hypothetical protein n=1 Tax=Ralstonia sp. TaxID=54061 RepID=UPI0025798AD6|nr:hypothetical protein [Ralstonia sp.]MBA4234003.1 hypothetical protein [Ralstonia sp.]